MHTSALRQALQYFALHQESAAALLEGHAGDVVFQIAGGEFRQNLAREVLHQFAVGGAHIAKYVRGQRKRQISRGRLSGPAPRWCAGEMTDTIAR